MTPRENFLFNVPFTQVWFRLKHGVPQKLSALRKQAFHRLQWAVTPARYDLVFVICEGNKGWILDALCKEIATYFPGKCHFHYSEAFLPPAKAYFFSHYSLYPSGLAQNPQIAQAKLLVFYTHKKSIGMSESALIAALNQATTTIFVNSRSCNELRAAGLEPAKSTYILQAADPDLFQPHERVNGAVGFCTAYYERKDPDRIFEIIKAMPHRQFILLGRNWQQYDRFEELRNLANFKYVEAPYRDYPMYYAQMDVFVSPSRLEGGPIPVIEAMMCNIFPVVSNTGHNPDLINSGENGFIFDTDASIDTICELIDRAFTMTTNVRKTVEHLSWKNFSLAVQALLQPTK
ncbi:MAG: glycosyltransferase family 4 protein [Myxacorys chilensis ATA2-1-KO14]|jgi:glycosyltransferase involved in cell wall biosynthesis|nr:glycosyltransferase family 4 protein [Myxacorys chilensis ATA2-1-KO14]